MAKRKRLSLPASGATMPGVSPGPDMLRVGLTQPPASRASVAPVAHVAGDAAAQAALDTLADEMQSAREEGRLVQALPLQAIEAQHLVRDRLALDPVEMESLKASLRSRGQQTPIEVVAQGDGHYGLISGWRRLKALEALFAETKEARFETVQALIKPLETVSDSYLAMVEENEIRAPLSFYERAHLACEAARLGIYPTPERAVQALFANTTSARRSKIGSFVKLHKALGSALSFPEAIPEKLGLALVSTLQERPEFASRLRDVLRKARPETAGDERALLERALRRGAAQTPSQGPREVVPGVHLEVRGGKLVLSGKGVTEDLQADLIRWLTAR